MKRIIFILFLIIIFINGCVSKEVPYIRPTGKIIELPEPSYDSDFSVEKALLERKSIREYSDETLSLKELSQILWAAQGITRKDGKRTTPSAGATYPLELYVLVDNVDNLEKGIYHYIPKNHTLDKISNDNLYDKISGIALNQKHVSSAPLLIVITAFYERTTNQYGDAGIRYVFMETGHAAQNIYLQATSLELGTVVVGSFNIDQLRTAMGLPINELPLYLMPVGKI